MTEQDYQQLINICFTIVLLLAPFAGLVRAVRRLRTKVESSTAPFFAGAVLAADAIAGIVGYFKELVALVAVLLAVIWLAAALSSNGLVRRSKAKLAKAAAAPPPPAPLT
jgi:hypothetical protein